MTAQRYSASAMEPDSRPIPRNSPRLSPKYIVYERNEESDKTVLAELLNCPADEIADPELAVQQIQNWLLSEGQDPKGDSVFDFLAKAGRF